MSGQIEHGGAAECPLPKETEEQAAERLQWEADQADQIAKDRLCLTNFGHIHREREGVTVSYFPSPASLYIRCEDGTTFNLRGATLDLVRDVIEARSRL